jgi:hypothetical protein
VVAYRELGRGFTIIHLVFIVGSMWTAGLRLTNVLIAASGHQRSGGGPIPRLFEGPTIDLRLAVSAGQFARLDA